MLGHRYMFQCLDAPVFDETFAILSNHFFKEVGYGIDCRLSLFICSLNELREAVLDLLLFFDKLKERRSELPRAHVLLLAIKQLVLDDDQTK